MSDHLCMHILLQAAPQGNMKPLKFFNHTAAHPRSLEVVDRIWNESAPLYHYRSTLKRLQEKLKSLKFELCDLNKDMFGDHLRRVMNYPDLFVTWIMRCIDTATFSVSINGELERFLSSSRVIRHVCSLSPYIYNIISNVLSKLLDKAALEGKIGYHPQCMEVNLSHLSFANDIVVFIDGTLVSLKGALHVF